MTSSGNGLKAIAALEAFKGMLSLLVGIGLHVLAGENLQQLAESIVSHAHLNPAKHLPGIFIHAMSAVTVGKMHLLAFGAFVYSVIRLIEAYGLWKEFVWTEWFALISGGIYLPFEIYEIFSHVSTLGVSVLLVNVIVVCYMGHILLCKRKEKRSSHIG
ncbi:DUF2127 domain-containing protein [Vibrio parahaemolyticus]|uniref:DUF2127 domain-containing protein n=1 Tax=Vibrio parahaemolyticus TaxID=670 RepID=UPI00046F51D7|nr:DUF2127 domain-containing protein [Vibrio parahaemolyticus]